MILFCLWVIFLGGAERLENTLLGYLEFGQLAEKAALIKVWRETSVRFFVSVACRYQKHAESDEMVSSSLIRHQSAIIEIRYFN